MPTAFTREHGCTEAEWLRCLPRAVAPHPLFDPAPGRARVAIDGGTLVLQWRVLPPRRIALVAIPRLEVQMRFDGIDPSARAAFMRRFDLVLQRGGG